MFFQTEGCRKKSKLSCITTLYLKHLNLKLLYDDTGIVPAKTKRIA